MGGSVATPRQPKEALADLQQPLQIRCRVVSIFVWDVLDE
jgi:hypothetical protein